MQTGKTDRRRYAPDKPQDCAYCYFWHGRKQKCGKKRCYYLLPEEMQDSVCREMGCMEIVRSALMDGIPPVSATACRRFFWICGIAARSEGKKVIRYAG